MLFFDLASVLFLEVDFLGLESAEFFVFSVVVIVFGLLFLDEYFVVEISVFVLGVEFACCFSSGFEIKTSI